jgi:beta-glucanase (GH16 family)
MTCFAFYKLILAADGFVEKPEGQMARSRIILSLIVLLAACTLEPQKGVEETVLPQGKNARLIFADEFSGRRLDTSKWNTSYHFWKQPDGGSTNEGNRELQWYLPRNVTVSHGKAKLTARKHIYRAPTGKRYAYTSGLLSSHRKFQFTYGYIEARVKVPPGKGLWSAFWMLPIPGSRPESKPEVDIMEFLGHQVNRVHFNLHYLNKDRQHRQVKDEHTAKTSFAKGWHTYAVRWQPKSLIFYIDGVEYHRVEGAKVPSKRMYLLLNLAVGGHWPGAPNKTTAFPSSLDIDYVRVYALNRGR